MKKRTETFIIIFVIASMAAMGFYMIHLSNVKMSLRNDFIQRAAKQGTTHKFVAEKYIDCIIDHGLFERPSKDQCIAQVMGVAKVRGVEFEQEAATAIRDLKLMK